MLQFLINFVVIWHRLLLPSDFGLLKKSLTLGIRLSPLLFVLACNSRWQQSPSLDIYAVEQPDTIARVQSQIGKTDKNLKTDLHFYFENPEKIDYQIIRQEVFEVGKCLDCHSHKGLHPEDNALLFGADMTEYRSLGFLNGIVPGVLITRTKADEKGNLFLENGSKIYESVSAHQSMPPVDRGYSLLDSERIKLLRLWILNCAPETIPENDNLLELKGSRGKVRICL